MEHCVSPGRQRTALFLVFGLFFLLFGGSSFAQTLMPIPAHSSSYTGYSRGYWFTSPVKFLIKGLRVPTDASTAPQSVLVVKFTSDPITSTTGATNYVVLGEWLQVPGTGIIPASIMVEVGDRIGIIGDRCVLPATNFNAINSYSANGPEMSTILG